MAAQRAVSSVGAMAGWRAGSSAACLVDMSAADWAKKKAEYWVASMVGHLVVTRVDLLVAHWADS